MGDIAFLLIIFFMVCSNFIKDTMTFKLPAHPDVEKLEQAQISVVIDEDGLIYLQGQKMEDVLAVQYGVSALIKEDRGPRGRTVLFKCDRNVDKEVFQPVMAAISEGGGIIAALGEKGKR